MSDLHVRDVEQADGEILVELVEEGRVVGYAYRDEGETFVEFVPDPDGSPWAFDVGDLQRALDATLAILDPEGSLELENAPGGGDAGGDHPVDVLAGEFDATAVRRGEEDEGFYPVPVVAAIIARCAELDLAVASLEAFQVHTDWIEPISGMSIDIGDAHAGEPWPMFKAGCQVQAEAVLETWGRRDGMAIALEVSDRDGDRFVL